MSRGALRFWISAVGVAVAWALIASWLLPYEALRLEGGEERFRAWLLTLWTSGVLAICFGAAGLLGHLTPLGIREVDEAGSLTRAIAARRASRRQGGGFHSNFAWWCIITGAFLIVIYFGAWGIDRG